MNPAKSHFLLYLLNTTNLMFNSGRWFDYLSSIEELFSKDKDLSKLGFSKEDIIKIKNPDWKIIEKDLEWVKQNNHHIITIYDSGYPDLLKEISNPPLLLFAIGDIDLLKSPQIAIVGSRNPTSIGIETATNFAIELVEADFSITSGFASGIDKAAHIGAIKANGKTIAVMGAGLKHIYPKYHDFLAEDIIVSGGLLLSEFPLDLGANSWHFPLRNRIISGLSVGTLVVEAALRSGSLITARLASEEGREVFAVPGSINNPKARGCHYLINQGAKLIEKTQDILDEFPGIIGHMPLKPLISKEASTKNKLDCEYRKLLDCMGFEIVGSEVLAKRTGFTPRKIGVMLLDLELQDLVKFENSGYVKV